MDGHLGVLVNECKCLLSCLRVSPILFTGFRVLNTDSKLGSRGSWKGEVTRPRRETRSQRNRHVTLLVTKTVSQTVSIKSSTFVDRRLCSEVCHT